MDENKKVVVNLPEGTTQAEIIVREGEAPAVLAPKPPVKIDLSGVIGAPVEFLELRRCDSEQINPLRCHVLVDREQVSITLITNEDDEYRRGRIVGKLTTHPKFSEFGINSGKGYVDYRYLSYTEISQENTYETRYGTTTWKKSLHASSTYIGVRNIQTDLLALGYTKVGSADGMYGANTEAAAKEFQADCNLTVDGIFGKNSKLKLWNLKGQYQEY